MRLISLSMIAALGLAAPALPSFAGTLLVPQQYPRIGAALAAARPYDTILVSPKPDGTPYNEALTVTTPHLVLQGRKSPVLDGTGLATVVPDPVFGSRAVCPDGIDIRADHVAVRGLTVQDFGFGDDANAPAAAVNVGYTAADGVNNVGFRDIEISGDTLQHNDNGIVVAGYTGNPVYGTATLLPGFRLLGDRIAGNSGLGASVTGNAVQVVGVQIVGNGGDGLDVTGDGLTVSGSEVGANAGCGVCLATSDYNPTAYDPRNPNPAASALIFNFVHDNGGGGLVSQGTQTLSANLLSGNVGDGILLYGADYTTVSYNVIVGTADSGGSGGDGTAIYADYCGSLGGYLTMTGNQIGGSAGDGLYLGLVGGCTVSGNNIGGSEGIGLHLSDAAFSDDLPGSTVVRNRSLGSAAFDAWDDTTAIGSVTYSGHTVYGDGLPATPNTWTGNVVGTANPPNVGG